jgi:hypothetical protein
MSKDLTLSQDSILLSVGDSSGNKKEKKKMKAYQNKHLFGYMEATLPRSQQPFSHFHFFFIFFFQDSRYLEEGKPRLQPLPHSLLPSTQALLSQW